MDKMASAGLTWQAYCESGCLRGNDHFPFTGFSTISSSPNIFAGNSASTADFVGAANSANPPNLLWFTPTDDHNMHNNDIQTGDAYLHDFFVGSSGTLANPASGSLLSSKLFQTGQRTLLLLWWDEFKNAPILFYGSAVKHGFISSSDVYDEFSILHLIENNWSLPTLTSNDATASPMTEIYESSTPPTGGSGGGSGTGSTGSCPLCSPFPGISNGLWSIILGGLVGPVAAITLLKIRARAKLARTKRAQN